MKKIILILTTLTFNLFSIELTTDIARKMGYYDFVHNLRLKANKHLQKLGLDIYNETRKFKDQKKFRKSDILYSKFSTALNFYSENIDNIFNNMSEEFIKGAYKLDFEEAPIVFKIRFVEYIRKKLLKLIKNILKKSSKDVENYVYAH